VSHSINTVEEHFRCDVIERLTSAYPHFLERIENAQDLRAIDVPFEGNLSTLIGGGSRHYPASARDDGNGLASGAVIGQISGDR